MIINVRTKFGFEDILKNSASGTWKVSRVMEANIITVRIFSWDMKKMLIADYEPALSSRNQNDDDLTIGLKNCKIKNISTTSEWQKKFGSATVVYSEEVSIQKNGTTICGIVRKGYSGLIKKTDIDAYFRRIIKEIKFWGINKIVFKSGGTIPIPQFFKDWCKKNKVTIEILSQNEINAKYPEENDIIWEDEPHDGLHTNQNPKYLH